MTSKNKRDLIIAAVLVAVFILVFSQNFLFRKKPRSAVSSEGADASNTLFLLTLARNSQVVRTPQEAAWDKPFGRDPFFQQKSEVTGTLANISLTGIVWDERMPVVMVNEKILKAGDEIEGYTIGRITQESVVFSRDGEESEVRLFKS